MTTTISSRFGVVAVIGLLLLLLNGCQDVECRRHRERSKDDYTLLVFGDSFVDVGNDRKSDLSRSSRGWYEPYGSSDSAHSNAPTGRLSDGLVQSDYLAKMLGSDESPPPYRLIHRDASGGVNFARPFSGVLNDAPAEELSLDGQIDQLRRLLNRGTIKDADLEESVALVSVSNSHDYSHISADTAKHGGADSYIQDVTDEIVDAVKRLLDLGVSKVLVNSLPPIGCAPWWTKGKYYAECNTDINGVATTHNTILAQKLGQLRGGDVLILDLYAAFNDVAGQSLMPCCVAPDYDGYCGQKDASGTPQYILCDSPDKIFYWDYIHPTQAAWKAVMDRLQPAIQNFLGI